MYAVVYVSSETNRFSDGDLAHLLTVSREKNRLSGITGLLLYKDGNFMQLLEGPEAAVRALFGKIKADHRHRGVRILMEEETSQREFGEWSMGYGKLDHLIGGEIEGYSDFLEVPLSSEAWASHSSKALRFLRIFKKSVL